MLSSSALVKRYEMGVARLTCLLLVLACSLAASAVSKNTAVRDETKSRVASSLDDLQRFNVTNSLDDLQASIDSLSSAVQLRTIASRHIVGRRRLVVRAWAQILHTIEASSDPTFDPTNPRDLPLMCIVPPREANGEQLPGCADPRDLQDPVARAAYVAAIKANAAKAQRMDFQTLLRHLDDDAMLSLRLSLADFRKRARPDPAALDEIVRQAGISDARRQKVDAMF